MDGDMERLEEYFTEWIREHNQREDLLVDHLGLVGEMGFQFGPLFGGLRNVQISREMR